MNPSLNERHQNLWVAVLWKLTAVLLLLVVDFKLQAVMTLPTNEDYDVQIWEMPLWEYVMLRELLCLPTATTNCNCRHLNLLIKELLRCNSLCGAHAA